PVIVDFLDDLAGGGRVLPKERAARYAALTLEALADGICDASLLQVYEVRMRAENERSASWIAHQSSKVERALGALEADPPAALTRADQADVGAVALACALGYLDLRFEGAWRAGHPRLVDWLGSFAAAVPAFGATKT
ncbi:MAG TPA: glutathione S-transferase C-terminal domain-containing protein, partial [Rhodoblastus sp.]|nr:glutathione S-transferase C-terminal domain-containing protein [Rhodoblastus sp.]